MIDLKLLRDDPDRVRASQRARGEDPDLVDAALAADERRRSAVTRYDALRAEQKTIGKQVAAPERLHRLCVSGGIDGSHGVFDRARDLWLSLRLIDEPVRPRFCEVRWAELLKIVDACLHLRR